jgi:DNA polymerase-3 subunit chi
MTEIDFYHHVQDRLQVAARITAKAYQRGKRVRILTGGEEDTQKLDLLLWCEPPIAFIPHCRMGSRIADRTPVWLDHRTEHDGPAEVLINLVPAVPSFLGRFQRLVEIITVDPGDVAAGRERFRAYRDRGYPIRTHDLAAERR